jgi:hypothetical protein
MREVGAERMGKAARRLGLAATLALAAWAPSAWGQTGFLWTPPSVSLALPRGGSTAFRCEVVNRGGARARFRMHVVSVGQGKDGAYFFAVGESVAERGEVAPSCAEWITVTPTEVTLDPGEGASIACVVRVPRRTTDGGCYAAVLCQLVPESAPGQPGQARVSITLSSATIVLLNVGIRRSRPRAEISHLSVTPSEEGGLWFEGGLTNLGDAHLFGRGRLVLRNAQGRRLAESRLGSGRGTVLPGATVAFRTLLQEPLPIGNYIAEGRIHYGGRGPAIARTPFEVGREMVMGGVTAGLAVTLSPEVVEMQIPARGRRVMKTVIVNREDRPVHVKMVVTGLVQDSLGQLAPAEEGEEGVRSAAGWVALRPEEFDLSPGERRTLPVTAAVPEGTEPGGRFAAIVGEVTGEPREGVPASAVVFGSLLLTVMGEVEAEAEVTRMELAASLAGGPPIVHSWVRNTSDIHVPLSRAFLTVTRMEAEGTVSLLEAPRTMVMDLPDEVLLPGAERELMQPVGGEPLRPGRYRATMRLGYSTRGEASATLDFRVGEEPGSS